jgi:hypothetical protein
MVHYQNKREQPIWPEFRYETADKAYFYVDRLKSTRRKAYVLAGNVVYLDRVEGWWVHGRYYGKSATAGWIRGRGTFLFYDLLQASRLSSLREPPVANS